MLLTLIEILVFMILAALGGLILGWLLRGSMGGEQQELTDLRSKLRACKKARSEAESGGNKKAATTNKVATAKVATVKGVQSAVAAKATSANAKDAKQTEVKPVVKEPAKTQKPTKEESKKSKPVVAKTKDATKSDSEKEAEKTAARAEVEKLVKRIGTDEVKDDLTAVYGVGPKYAGILNDMGITSFKQISQFSKEDISMVAAAIGAFKDRVERDDWVAGAKTAHKEKYGKEL